MNTLVRTWILSSKISLSKVKRLEEEKVWQFYNTKLYLNLQVGDVVYINSHVTGKTHFIAVVKNAEIPFSAGVVRLEVVGMPKIEVDLTGNIHCDKCNKYNIVDITNDEECLNVLDRQFHGLRYDLLAKAKRLDRQIHTRKEIVIEWIIAIVIGVVLSIVLSGNILFIVCAFVGLLGMALLAIL